VLKYGDAVSIVVKSGECGGIARGSDLDRARMSGLPVGCSRGGARS